MFYIVQYIKIDFNLMISRYIDDKMLKYYNNNHHQTRQIKTNNISSIKKLIIYPKLDEISTAIGSSMITVIEANTGFGKTMGIPNILAKNKNLKGNIFCSVPNITVAISSYQFQSQLLDNFSDEIVGYADDKNINHDISTKVVYCTTNYLLNKIIIAISRIFKGEYNHYNPWFCSVLILDDLQTRTKNLDICLCLWIYYYNAWKKNLNLPKPPKLVIITTSINEGLKLLPTQPSYLLYKIKSYPITICYDNESDKFGPESENRYIRTATLAHQYHMENHHGIYLIFAPGEQEIKQITTELEKKFNNNAIILSVHNESTLEDLNNIYELNHVTSSKRKIIIATNIMEYLITIDNISLVIDSMVDKNVNSVLDENTETIFFWISKSNSDQRKNKTGRTCSGTYVIMQSKENYLLLSNNNIPEIKKNSINYDILNLIKNGLDPIPIFAPIIDEKQTKSYIDLLRNLGFIADDKITNMMDFCSKFPLDIRKAAMIYHLVQHNNPNIFLHLAVICTIKCYGNGIFIWPNKHINEDIIEYSLRRDEITQKIENKFAGYSDTDTLFKIWIDICSKINPFYIKDLKSYCHENYVNFYKLRETTLILKKCITIGNTMGLHFQYNFPIQEQGNNKTPSNIYHNTKKFKIPSVKILGKTFYQLLSLTHQDYEIRFYQNSKGKIVANYDNTEYQIDNKAIHSMNVGNNNQQICYLLIKNQKYTKAGILKIINVFHAVPKMDNDNNDDNNNDDKFSIFSSDAGSEYDSLRSSFSDIQNWNNYLPSLEIDNSMTFPEYFEKDDD